jgi:hypothetical protein
MNRPGPTWTTLLVLAAILMGCVIVRSDDFTYHDAQPVRDSPLRLDGYYYRIVERDTTREFFSGPRIYPVLLWKDGTAMVSSRGWSGRRSGTLKEARTRFESSADSVLSRRKRSIFSWGRFRIKGDSISIQTMNYTSGLSYIIAQMVPAESNGVILNDTTFVLRETKIFSGIDEGTYKYETKYHFSPLDDGEKPPSENWTQTHPDLQ